MSTKQEIPKERLLDFVLEQIIKDVESGELLPIEELLKSVPEQNLKAYLPEKEEE